MKPEVLKRNVAPDSDNGHFVVGQEQVIELDLINETFFVEGAHKMETKNHETMETDTSAIVTCQQVVDPYTGYFERVRD